MPRFSFAIFSSLPVVMVAAALLLSGCQGGSTPGSSPSETRSTTASPSSSATPSTAPSPAVPAGVYKPADAKGKAENVPVPVMPELAKQNTKEGLEAFIGYYYAVRNYANATGDVIVLSTLSTPECKVCTHMQKASTESYIDGRWMAGGDIRIPRTELEWKPGETAQVSKLQLIQDAIAYYNSDGTEGRPASVATNSAFIVVAKVQISWKVVEIGVLR